MIRLIKGTVQARADTGIVVETNDIGRLVHTTKAHRELALGSEVILHTHLAVRETALDLYGFTDEEMLSYFELLLTIPKIGPKLALQILENTGTQVLATAIASEDAKYLKEHGGVGTKTAEKIVVNLKDKLPASLESAAAASTPDQSHTRAYEDAVAALVALGYPSADVRRALRDQPAEDTNTLVRYGLSALGRF